MARIRMNDDYRKKILNKYIESAELESTYEKEAYLDLREKVKMTYETTHELARQVVERAYPTVDVELCQDLKRRYGRPLDVVAQDKCFYFSSAKDEDSHDDECSEHIDFGLYGATNQSNYNNDSGRQFAYAYFRDELKAKGCNADIFPQQKNNQDNPHKHQHIEANDKELGYSNYSSYSSDNDRNIGLCKEFDNQWYLDIIGTSHCRSRTIACTVMEFDQFKQFKQMKAQLSSAHETWIDTIEEQKKAMMTGLKAYRYLDEGVELMNELGVVCDESDLITVNSTGLSIYNPTNLASMVKGMKNKTMTREQKIAERQKYDQDNVVVIADAINTMQ